MDGLIRLILLSFLASSNTFLTNGTGQSENHQCGTSPFMGHTTTRMGLLFWKTQQDLPFSNKLKTTMVDASKLADKLGSPARRSQHVLLALSANWPRNLTTKESFLEDWQYRSEQMDWKMWTPLTFASHYWKIGNKIHKHSLTRTWS